MIDTACIISHERCINNNLIRHRCKVVASNAVSSVQGGWSVGFSCEQARTAIIHHVTIGCYVLVGKETKACTSCLHRRGALHPKEVEVVVGSITREIYASDAPDGATEVHRLQNVELG